MSGALAAAALLVVAGCGGGQDSDDTTEAKSLGSHAAVCEAAADEDGPAIWYESALPEQAKQLLAAFNKSYPDVDIEHATMSGGTGFTGKIIQETQANARTADFASGSFDLSTPLIERGLLVELDPKEIGITDDQLQPSPYLIMTASTLAVGAYNSEIVSSEDAPKSWEDFADPKWKGEQEVFQRQGLYYATLETAWGKERTEALGKKMAALEPRTLESGFQQLENVAAGKTSVTVALDQVYNTLKKTGAPIEMVVMDPVLDFATGTGIVKGSKHQNSAKCLIGWLITPEGAKALHDATGRANRLIEGTDSHESTNGKDVVMVLPDEMDESFQKRVEYYSGLLTGR